MSTVAQTLSDQADVRFHLKAAIAQLNNGQITTAHAIMRHAAQFARATEGDPCETDCPYCIGLGTSALAVHT